MEKEFYEEMLSNLKKLEEQNVFLNKEIYLFGHCHATEVLVDVLCEKEYRVVCILDNNSEKQGKQYKQIPVCNPMYIISDKEHDESKIVLIVSRFFEEMKEQLGKLGFLGDVIRLVDYNSFAQYSLSNDTIIEKSRRLDKGKELVRNLKIHYEGFYRLYFPFNALGDIYFAMSYLPAWRRKKSIKNFMIIVPSNVCAKVVRLFDDVVIEVMKQEDLDVCMQAEINEKNEDFFIVHQDRPYVIKLHKMLYHKCIPLDLIYRCGIYGLPLESVPVEASRWKEYDRLEEIEKGKSVVLSPYAKSVTELPMYVWKEIIEYYLTQGYNVYTNVVGNERALPKTIPLQAELAEMKSILEKAGTFIGIRSGLCDVIRSVNCTKIALFPDYNYGDTKWKAIDMYYIEGFKNLVVGEGFKWNK